MKSALKIILYNVLFFTLSCKKTSPKEAEIIKVPPADEHAIKHLIPVKFESDNLLISLKYRKNTAELIEISGSDGYTMTISYKNEQPYILNKLKDSQQFETIDYVWNKQGIPKARVFEDNGTVSIHKGSYELTYSEGTLSKVMSYSNNGTLLRETIFRYTAGNLTDKTILDLPAQSQNITYTCDTKNGIFKHLNYSERLLPESRYTFLADGKNNRLSSSNTKFPQENTTSNYQYNNEGYPAEFTITDSRGKQTFKITYIELKP